jgi:hypothetical protein
MGRRKGALVGRKRSASGLALVALVLAATALSAVGAQAKSGPRITRFTATVVGDPFTAMDPTIDPAGRILGASLHFGLTSTRAPQRQMEILLPAGLQLNFAPFNVCSPSPHIKKACIVAFGSVPGAGYFSVVNGPPSNGTPSLWVKWGTASAPASYAGAASPYGARLTLNIPRTHRGRRAFKVLHFFTDLRQRSKAPNAAFLQQVGPCPSGGWPVRVRFSFANRQSVHAATTAECLSA